MIYKVKDNTITLSSQEECLRHLKNQSVLGLDTETTGLDPYLNQVVTIQIGTTTEQYVLDVRSTNPEFLREILQSNTIKKVLVNAKFDYKMLAANFNIRLENISDCMLQEMLILGAKAGSHYSMEKLAKKYLGYSFGSTQLKLFNEDIIYKSTRTEFSEIDNDSDIPSKLILYAANDVVLPLQIHEKQSLVLAADQLNVVAELENRFVLALGDIELNGFYVNRSRWLELYEVNRRRYNWTKYLLNEWLLENGCEKFVGMNFNSSKQVIALFKFLDIPTRIIDTKKSRGKEEPVYKDSVQKQFIKKYAGKFRLVRLYLRFKELSKAVTAYGIKFLEHVHPTTNRVHSSYRQILNTGRISSTNPNLQNITATSSYRSCFQPQSEKTSLIVCDYSGQESRIMADISGDKNLVEFFLYGDGDLHSHTARKMFNIHVDSKTNTHLRQMAKVLNFGIPYGMSAYKLSRDFEIPLKEAERFIEQWFEAYPGLRRHFARVKQFAQDNGFIIIDNVTKRRFYSHYYKLYLESKKFIDRWLIYRWKVPKIFWSTYFSAKGKLEREAQNYQIQGTGASMTKLACVLIRDYIRENDMWNDVKIVNTVHDEIVVECSKNLIPIFKDKLKFFMEEAGRRLCPIVPMQAKPVVSDVWNH